MWRDDRCKIEKECAGGILLMLNRRTLHCIRIRDDTPQQQYLKLVER
ncbi:MAG: hypothetical protein J5988_06955 [Eubacterium sp.]|nr:hypothetical protein [Eubacterium sp.]